MKLSSRIKKDSFTLIELLVVIAIIVILSTIVLANYRGGEEQYALQRSAHQLAQDIRKAEEMAMASKEFNGEIPQGGYGIYLVENSNSYILFADVDGEKDYDSGEEVGSPLELEKKVKICELSPSSSLFITFTPPDPTINISEERSEAKITLCLETDSSKTKIISVNKAGLIEIK